MKLDPTIEVGESESVYPPSEDTLLLLEAIDLRGASTFLEVGSGTGLVALHAARECDVVATDVNPHAVALIRRNADANDLSLGVVRSDLVEGLRGTFDVIAFNPPYLPVVEGKEWLERSWSGGPDGNEVILIFLDQIGSLLSGDGVLYLLLSSHNHRALRRARQLYDVTPVVRQSLFFEEIVVYRLRPRAFPENNL